MPFARPGVAYSTCMGYTYMCMTNVSCVICVMVMYVLCGVFCLVTSHVWKVNSGFGGMVMCGVGQSVCFVRGHSVLIKT